MAQPADFDFFRSILEDLHLAVYLVNRDGKIVFWNDGAERITGYLRQDVIGRIDNDNLLGETDGDDKDLSGPLAPTAVAIREGKPIQAHRVSLRHKSGHRVPVELWSFPVRNAEGAIVGAAVPPTPVMSQDIGKSVNPQLALVRRAASVRVRVACQSRGIASKGRFATP